MKKWNIILPLLAFLFAVVAAFATTMEKDSSSVILSYWDPENGCEECTTPIGDTSTCAPENKGTFCECKLTEQVTVTAFIESPTEGCLMAQRPKDP